MLSFAPQFDTSGEVICNLSVDPSRAINLQEALGNNFQIHALVSAENPYNIVAANAAFMHRFSCVDTQVVGKPVRKAFGAGAEVEGLVTCAAKEGRRIHRLRSSLHDVFNPPCIEQYNSELVECIPVVGSYNSKIDYVLIVFSSASSFSEILTEHSAQEQPKQSDPHFYDMLWEKAPLPAISSILPDRVAVGNQSTAVTSPPAGSGKPTPPQDMPAAACNKLTGIADIAGSRAPGAGPLFVVPRRRLAEPPGRGGAGGREQPIPLTAERLLSLQTLPLPLAARAVGLSATAFKRACRRLGVQRWAYTRGPARGGSRPKDGRRGPSPPPGSTLAAGPAIPSSAPPPLCGPSRREPIPPVPRQAAVPGSVTAPTGTWHAAFSSFSRATTAAVCHGGARSSGSPRSSAEGALAVLAAAPPQPPPPPPPPGKPQGGGDAARLAALSGEDSEAPWPSLGAWGRGAGCDEDGRDDALVLAMLAVPWADPA